MVFDNRPSVMVVVVPCMGLVYFPWMQLGSSMLIIGGCLLGILVCLCLDTSVRVTS